MSASEYQIRGPLGVVNGTANITFRTPLLTTQVDECWDELACLTFVRDPLSVTKLCGVNASCGVAAACPTVP